MKKIDPTAFNLSPRTLIEQVGNTHYLIVIKRKSRIIMADAEKILLKAAAIHKSIPGAKISVATSAPICGKSQIFLLENSIDIRVTEDV